MHSPPVVDPQTLQLFRKRLAWGLLGLPQPPQDLALALKEFAERWSTSRPPPPVEPWQAYLLDRWRSHPRALRDVAALDPVLETMVQALAYRDGESLNDSFRPLLTQLARSPLQADTAEAYRPVLKAAWQQISLAMQRLRPGLGSYSHEAQLTLSKFLAAMQNLNDYFRHGERASLQEASWRFAESLDEWDRLATLMLTGLQPVSSALLWGLLLDALGPHEPSQQALSTWFADWAMDLAHVLAPYLASFSHSRSSPLAKALEDFGRSLLGWHKLLPGWHQDVMPAWHRLLNSFPEPLPYGSPPEGFRWLEPHRMPSRRELSRGLWSRWQNRSADAELGLERVWPLARLLVLLADPSFRRFEVPFPEAEIIHQAGGWLVTGPNQHSRETQQALQHLITA